MFSHLRLIVQIISWLLSQCKCCCMCNCKQTTVIRARLHLHSYKFHFSDCAHNTIFFHFSLEKFAPNTHHSVPSRILATWDEVGTSRPVPSRILVTPLLCTVQMAESIEYDFVEQPTQDHFCVVTLELLRDPHQTTCCGHHLSQEAASRLQRDGKPCPMCQRPNLSTHADLYFRRKVNEINVRCPQKSQGCKWVGEVGGLDRHLGSQCLWARVSCPKSCGGSVLRGNLPLHLDADCPKRNYRCKYCQFQATYEVVQKQHIPQCPKQTVRCPNHCEIRTVERSNLDKHMSECPLQLVECEFSQAGCKEKVPRRDLVSHVRENAQQHLLSMSLLNLTLTRELREKMEEKDQQIAELREELKQQGKEIEQRDRQLNEQVTHLQQDLQKQIEQSQQQFWQLKQQLEREHEVQQRGQQETRLRLKDIESHHGTRLRYPETTGIASTINQKPRYIPPKLRQHGTFIPPKLRQHGAFIPPKWDDDD